MDRRIVRFANVVLGSAALMAAAALAYALLDRRGRVGSPADLALYYGAPAALLLGLGALSRARAELRVNVALLLLSLAVPLYAAEAFLGLRRSGGLSDEMQARADSLCPGHWQLRGGCVAAAEAGIPFDTRSVLDVVDDLAAEGRTAWPNLDGNILADTSGIHLGERLVLPLQAGEPEVLTVFCNEQGEWLLYDADEIGFNNPKGLAGLDPVSLVVLGDSFAHGWCVPRESTVASVLAERFGTALNLGVEGTGPLHHLGVLREYAAPRRPRNVVWLFCEGNDLVNLERELRHPVYAGYLRPDFRQGLAGLSADLAGRVGPWIVGLNVDERQRVLALRRRQAARASRPAAHPLVGWLTLRSLRSAAANAARALGPGAEEARHPFDRAAFRRIMTLARDETAAWGGTLTFGYLPDVKRWTQPEAMHDYREEILTIVRDLGIPVVDLMTTFEAHPDPPSLFPFRSEVHYTEEGYRLVADAVAEALDR